MRTPNNRHAYSKFNKILHENIANISVAMQW